jgi:hypothetical protein
VDSFNRGFRVDPNANLPDNLRDSSFRMNHTGAEINALMQAAARGNHQRCG